MKRSNLNYFAVAVLGMLAFFAINKYFKRANSVHSSNLAQSNCRGQGKVVAEVDTMKRLSRNDPLPQLVAPFDDDRAREVQQLWAKSLASKPVKVNSSGVELILIPPGSFQVKTKTWHEDSQEDWKPAEVSAAFFISRTEITQKQWKAIMNTTPWRGNDEVKEGDDYPAVFVSWTECDRFCRLLGERERSPIRLPTEVEWEYCCRSGTNSDYCFGDSTELLGEYAWYYNNTVLVDNSYAHQCRIKQSNGFGLTDMHGNVWEWCQDSINTPSPDVVVEPPEVLRVHRGGSWSMPADLCVSGMRVVANAGYADVTTGFRIVETTKQPR